jgi:hypothetical protein
LKAARQGKERPLKSGPLAESCDFSDELCCCQRRPTGKRRDFKDGASIDGPRRYRADHVLDGSVEVAFGEKSVVVETKTSRTKNLVTMIQQRDDVRRKLFEPSAISSRVGVLDELLGRTLARVVVCKKNCLAHLASRPQDWDWSRRCRSFATEACSELRRFISECCGTRPNPSARRAADTSGLDI